jgi:hypothetical protein
MELGLFRFRYPEIQGRIRQKNEQKTELGKWKYRWRSVVVSDLVWYSVFLPLLEAVRNGGWCHHTLEIPRQAQGMGSVLCLGRKGKECFFR